MSIADNITVVRNRIDAALARRRSIGLETGSVKLVAVTKNQGVMAVQAAIGAGIDCIGENRVQEALTKQDDIGRSVEWHLLGHLQTNKARQAVAAFDLIHSVDSERLAVELDKAAAKLGKRQAVLLQVNIAGEETKFGIDADQTFRLADKIMSFDHLELSGLMTIAPYFEDTEESRPVFQQMYQLFTRLRSENGANTNITWLSMGMTNDYQVAIEEGSNLVRIGTAIFGPRQY